MRVRFEPEPHLEKAWKKAKHPLEILETSIAAYRSTLGSAQGASGTRSTPPRTVSFYYTSLDHADDTKGDKVHRLAWDRDIDPDSSAWCYRPVKLAQNDDGLMNECAPRWWTYKQRGMELK